MRHRTRSQNRFTTTIAVVALALLALTAVGCSTSDDESFPSAGDTTAEVDAGGSTADGDTGTAQDGGLPDRWPDELTLPEGFELDDAQSDDTTGRIQISGSAPGAAPELFEAWQGVVGVAGCERTKGSFATATGVDEKNELWEDSACDGYSVIAKMYQDGDVSQMVWIYNAD